MSEQTILSVRVHRARQRYKCTAYHEFGLIDAGELYFRMFWIDHDQYGDPAIADIVCHDCMKSCTYPKVLEALKEYDRRKALEKNNK